jgi:hypothetical protein
LIAVNIKNLRNTEKVIAVLQSKGTLLLKLIPFADMLLVLHAPE